MALFLEGGGAGEIAGEEAEAGEGGDGGERVGG